VRFLLHFRRSKYDSAPLGNVLKQNLGETKLGHSKKRLIIASLNLETGEVHIWQRLQPFQKFAHMIAEHWDGIEAYCHAENKVVLGFVESLNNKIRVIQRRAYGFRDEEYLRLKILACMLPKL
jgi:transposase